MKRSMVYLIFGLSMIAHVFTYHYYQFSLKQQKKKEREYQQICKEGTKLLNLNNGRIAYNYIKEYAHLLDFQEKDSLEGIAMIAYLLKELSYYESPEESPFFIDKRLSKLIGQIPMNVELLNIEMIPYNGPAGIDSLVSEINRSRLINRLSSAFTYCGPIFWDAKAVTSFKAPIEIYEGDTLELNVHTIYESYLDGAFYKLIASPFIQPTYRNEGILKYPTPQLRGNTPTLIEKELDIHVKDVLTGDTSIFEKALSVSILVKPKRNL